MSGKVVVTYGAGDGRGNTEVILADYWTVNESETLSLYKNNVGDPVRQYSSRYWNTVEKARR